ncbi:hypothetical protein [Halorussus caseinilyticus]|uniref:DUF309 domain-containing protein n=1 Tax=Halorussus caseinilyticus TaxID=3034025 RepID=A0ABD5WL28_9EURY|nr:hypothetical protein [Halorussus sp. DT72]
MKSNDTTSGADDDRYCDYEAANQHRRAGRFSEAGDDYTLAAYHRLGEGQVTREPLEDGQTDVARGLCNLLSAVVCYRLGGEPERAANRAEQGELIATDIREYVAAYEPQRGLMDEYVGDFRLLGGLPEFDGAYRDAQAVYADTSNQIGWQAEPEFEVNMTLFLELARAADHDIERTKKAAIKTESLVERIRYKRDAFPGIVADVVEAGDW